MKVLTSMKAYLEHFDVECVWPGRNVFVGLRNRSSDCMHLTNMGNKDVVPYTLQYLLVISIISFNAISRNEAGRHHSAVRMLKHKQFKVLMIVWLWRDFIRQHQFEDIFISSKYNALRYFCWKKPLLDFFALLEDLWNKLLKLWSFSIQNYIQILGEEWYDTV